ncbi:MAG: sodium:solute symporter family protein, partial [Oscillospiraceae bacterium]|nr:sodium:solute symporter family protein [Oscillospiraceae bacterium]
MEHKTVIWLTIAVYIVFIAIVGIMNARKSKNITQFTVGGRNAGAWLSAFSYGTAYFSAVMFIGYAGGTGWKYGLWGILPGIGNAVIGSLIAWLVLAKRTRETTRRLEIKSMPQLFEKRFKSEKMKTFCVAVIFLFLIPYSASVYKGLTSVCSVLLGVDERVCMIVIAIASLIIVILGGYGATLKADFVQGTVMLVGVICLIIAVMRSQTVGGFSQGLQAIAQKTEELNLTAVSHMGLWATVLMTSFGTWGLPQMIHKYYGIRDDQEVKRGTIISTFFAFIVAGGGYFIGSLARLFFNSLEEIPGAGSGKTDYLIPNMLKMSGISEILIGIILVLLIAASVSTLSSITITATTTLTMDFIRPKIFKNLDDVKSANVSRILCFLFVVFSYIIANSDTPILDMMSYSWGIISGSFLAPYAISLYWKKLNRSGAWAGILGGFFTALPPVICKLFFPEA